MALPLIGGVIAGVAGFSKIIVGIVTAITFIVKFIKNFIFGLVARIASYFTVIAVNGILLAIVITYYYLTIDLLVDAYNLIDQFLENLSMKNTSSQELNLLKSMLGACLFFDALKDALNLFKPLISSILICVVYTIGTKVLLAFRNSVLSTIIARL